MLLKIVVYAFFAGRERVLHVAKQHLMEEYESRAH